MVKTKSSFVKTSKDKVEKETPKYNPSEIEKKWSHSAKASAGKQKYDPQKIEKKWQAVWAREKTYQPDLDSARKPFYNLMMFPYPSAEGMHVGNMYAFTGSDVYGRFKRMQGYDVFEPIGLDGFGIHSENYALKIGKHPKEQARISQENFYRQLHAIGNGFAWDNKAETYDPDYYKWTQWIFIQLFKAGLAYRKKASVNFCPSCKTVLADEQVITGKCERCGTEVVKKELEQWFFRITDYAERLLNNIDVLDWTEKVKIAQREWIGRSEGTEIEFKIQNSKFRIKVFTTRPDTLFGATFMVLAPEHPLVAQLLKSKIKNQKPKIKEIEEYVKIAQTKTEQERIAEDREKTGVDTGYFAINPVNNEAIPIWIADYVLGGYGTGAIMAVPAHDTRDYEFAVKYNLPIIQVVANKKAPIRSYLMGGEEISDEDLKKLGIKILDTTKKGYRRIEIPQSRLKDYEKLIEDKLTLGFWNEYVGGEDIVFIFKYKDGKIRRFILDRDNEEEIDKLSEEFNGRIWKKKSSVWKWLAKNDTYTDLIVHIEPGVIVNSQDWNGLEVPSEMSKIIDDLEKKGIGKRKVQYHLRDWLISRQRYWGPPIPLVFCENCASHSKGFFDVGSERLDLESLNSGNQDIKKSKSKISHFSHQENPMYGWFPVPNDQLPVLLPDVKDWKPMGAGESPLAAIKEFVNTKCPKCGGEAQRETDVSDTFLDSAWYFFRYIATDLKDIPFPSPAFMKARQPHLPDDARQGNSKSSNIPRSLNEILSKSLAQKTKADSTAFSSSENGLSSPSVNDKWKMINGKSVERTANWLPVDMYIGGAEHSVLHLLYSRFITMVFKDLKLIDFEEPYAKFRAHGLLIKEGAKMSKSKGNVVIPDAYIRKFGADTLRLYLMFLGPFTQGGDFYDTGIEGMYRFVKRVWILSTRISNFKFPLSNEAQRMMHKTIKKVTEDLESLRYNTAIASMMEYYNFLSKEHTISKDQIKTLILLISPFAPHVSEELWHLLGGGNSVHKAPWPEFEKQYLAEQIATVVVQINGKTRDVLGVDSDEINDKQKIVHTASKSPKVQKYINNKPIQKIIYVPGKIINFVLEKLPDGNG